MCVGGEQVGPWPPVSEGYPLLGKFSSFGSLNAYSKIYNPDDSQLAC